MSDRRWAVLAIAFTVLDVLAVTQGWPLGIVALGASVGLMGLLWLGQRRGWIAGDE